MNLPIGWPRAAILLVAALAPATASAAEPAPKVLDTYTAFRVGAEYSGKAIRVRLRIADGHYLYRAKLRFAVEPAAARLRVPALPKGEAHEDEFFGRSEIYRGELAVTLPVGSSRPPESVVLKVRSQGCADAGICYPPREDVLTLVKDGGERSVAPPGQSERKSLIDALGDESSSPPPAGKESAR